MIPPDAAARRLALTRLDATLLVEAAAGAGKTSLLAGRLALLLADGAAPGSVAAISFTELAAGELSARVRMYAEALAAGDVPDALALALPDGVSEPRRRRIAAALGRLDEVAITTIHGFCRTVLRDHGLEVGVDPGFRVLEAEEAEAAFASCFDDWLSGRLDGRCPADDVVGALAREDPSGAVDLLRGLARFRLEHPGCRPADLSSGGRPDVELADAVDAFARWAAGVPSVAALAEAVSDLERLAAFYRDAFAATPDAAALWRLARPPRVGSMRRDTLDLAPPRCRGAWRRIAGADEAARIETEARRHQALARSCYAAVLGRVADGLLGGLCAEADGALAAYRAFKRAAAVLDFNDLVAEVVSIVRKREDVRRELSKRFRYILVDEFQDTDPAQTEILFRLAAERAEPRWEDCVPRPGSLFLVGDPKQSLYAFRGADVVCYATARAALLARSPEALVEVAANFRSRPGILRHVDLCFAGPLSGPAQPGYVAMAPVRGDSRDARPCAARLPLRLPPDARAEETREVEADAVARFCASVIGAMTIEDADGSVRRLRPGDVVLLAPVATDLWRYERALHARGIPVASMAGKGFHRRQEVQDLMCLARVLADARDTLAFGALLRGPLVGMTDEALLDATEALSLRRGDDRARLALATDPREVDDPRIRDVLAALQVLRRKAASTTPHALLSEAVASLCVRPIVSLRSGGPAALANVDAFLEMSRGYGVRGLKGFVRDLDAAWRAAAPREEGRPHGDGLAVEIVTMHGAKGLEWPVVVPINAGSRLRGRGAFVRRMPEGTMHWTIGGVVPPELEACVAEADAAAARERERVWYVAATRARELLVVPHVASAAARSWARSIDMRLGDLPAFDASWLEVSETAVEDAGAEGSDADDFAREAAAIAAAAIPLRWLRPSDRDPDRVRDADRVVVDGGLLEPGPRPVGAGRLRGLLLHKLLEEILTGELDEVAGRVEVRAAELVDQLDADGDERPRCPEMAATALSTLALEPVAEMRAGLVPEVAVRSFIGGEDGGRPVDGRADAVFVGRAGIEVVVDWKSDVDPTPREMTFHETQMRLYMSAIGAPRGLIVYMTGGHFRWIDAGAFAPDSRCI